MISRALTSIISAVILSPHRSHQQTINLIVISANFLDNKIKKQTILDFKILAIFLSSLRIQILLTLPNNSNHLKTSHFHLLRKSKSRFVRNNNLINMCVSLFSVIDFELLFQNIKMILHFSLKANK